MQRNSRYETQLDTLCLWVRNLILFRFFIFLIFFSIDIFGLDWMMNVGIINAITHYVVAVVLLYA